MLSDHKSDCVVQGYIDRGSEMRDLVTRAVTVPTFPRYVPLTRTRDDDGDSQATPPALRSNAAATGSSGVTFIVNGPMTYSHV